MKAVPFLTYSLPFSPCFRGAGISVGMADKPRPVMGKIKVTVLFAHKSLSSLMIFRAFRSGAVRAKSIFRDFPGLPAVPAYAALTGSPIND
jgi:hypothetical protein